MAERPCPFCGAPLQEWRFWNVENYSGDQLADYIAVAVDNNPDLSPEHAVYHIPESA